MYNFYIDDVQLPVAPSAMSTSINNKNETITLINEGEVNILRKPGLTDISFTAMLPNVNYPFAVYTNGFQNAKYYLDKLESLKLSKKPFQFIVVRMSPRGELLFNTNITVSLEDYEIEEDAENGFDINVSINLKQFVPFGNKKLVVQERTNNNAAVKSVTVEKKRSTEGKKPNPKTYTVKSGDTLWAISKKFFGTGNKVNDLAKLNNISNPSVISLGQVIRLE